VLKLSAKKATAPGRKQVFRGRDGDVLALRDEPIPDGAHPLLVPAMKAGERVIEPEPVAAMRERFEVDLGTVPASARRLAHPEPVVARRSQALLELTRRAGEEALLRAGLRTP
jgi:nicotinate phosphoribosyltransferase